MLPAIYHSTLLRHITKLCNLKVTTNTIANSSVKLLTPPSFKEPWLAENNRHSYKYRKLPRGVSPIPTKGTTPREGVGHRGNVSCTKVLDTFPGLEKIDILEQTFIILHFRKTLLMVLMGFVMFLESFVSGDGNFFADCLLDRKRARAWFLAKFCHSRPSVPIPGRMFSFLTKGSHSWSSVHIPRRVFSFLTECSHS